jgi:hypothetical protein
MNTNIEISNINKHFFPIKERNNEEEYKRYTTKLTEYNFYSINEANISDIIKNIPYYSNNYLVVEDYDFVNISKLDDKYIEKINLNDNKKYLIFKYKNEKTIDFNDFLTQFTNPKEFIFNIIESFSYILNSLVKLNNENICFFNLSPENTVFNLDCGEKPQIQNFNLSLQVLKLNEKYITDIIKKQNDYTHKPLEVHILFYIIQNDILYISYSFIEEICEVYINNLSILNLFSENYKESYKASCIKSLSKYINKTKTYIINDILNYYDKWDVYSLSVLYLHIFGNITRTFSLKQTFISKITVELSKNISPEPSDRNSLEILLENYNKLFDDENDWSFVKKIESNKMTKLFELLEK